MSKDTPVKKKPSMEQSKSELLSELRKEKQELQKARFRRSVRQPTNCRSPRRSSARIATSLSVLKRASKKHS